jgi:hypothetical protein
MLLWRHPPHANRLNGYIINAAAIIKNVVMSAAESEVGAFFQNAQSGAPLSNDLHLS